jgi:uncharacterized protein
MLSSTAKVLRRRTFKVKLPDHHARCELHYRLCLTLFPGNRDPAQQWYFSLSNQKAWRVKVQVEDVSPYTSTLVITQTSLMPWYFHAPQLKVRLYHDAAMAEVIAWNKHRGWQPVYDYPNERMYHPDEKMALNRFLGELLMHCRQLERIQSYDCERILKKINSSKPGP